MDRYRRVDLASLCRHNGEHVAQQTASAGASLASLLTDRDLCSRVRFRCRTDLGRCSTTSGAELCWLNAQPKLVNQRNEYRCTARLGKQFSGVEVHKSRRSSAAKWLCLNTAAPKRAMRQDGLSGLSQAIRDADATRTLSGC